MSLQPRSSGEEPPMKKTRRKKKTKQQPISILSLPEDLLLSCLARISTVHYPSLSLVSKRFQTLLSSPELYKTRSLLGRIKTCLYVCVRCSDDDPNPRWYTLCQKPSRKNKSSSNLLVPIPNLISPPASSEGVVALGSSIYVIGNGSDVWVLDCHCHAWRKAPCMRVKRTCPAANVFDGKIYVAGGYKDSKSSNWMEVFDPKTQTWESVVCPLAETNISRVYESVVIEETIYYRVGYGHCLAYKPKEDRWETVGYTNLSLGWAWFAELFSFGFSDCVIDNVLYCFSDPLGFRYYNSNRKGWRKLNGLEGLPKFSSLVQLADYGGKLAVFWTKQLRSNVSEDKIWCAVIVLERRNDDEIWGTVEQRDPVLKVPRSFAIECIHAATA